MRRGLGKKALNDLDEFNAESRSTVAMARGRKTARWQTPLARSLPVKDGGTLTTLDDARAFILDAIPAGHHDYASWQLAGRLLIHAAESGIDIDAATFAMESALFLDYQLDLKRQTD